MIPPIIHRVRPWLGILLISLGFLVPQIALAKEEWFGDVSILDLPVGQSAFRGLSSCEEKYPYRFAGNPFRYIEVPDYTDPATGAVTPKKAYRGTGQQDSWVNLDGSFGKSVWFCNQKEVNEKLSDGKGGWHNPYAVAGELGAFASNFVWAVGTIMSFFASMAIWVISLTSHLLKPLLSAGSFITNPMVTSGWPFVQGIANIGFLLALLFIAFATTLRLESFGARRMLPRLLIAALLINFSLVITGLLIDVSRLVMAALLTILTQSADIDSLAFKLLTSSDLITNNFKLNTFAKVGYAEFVGSTNSWSAVASIAQATVLIWGLAIGFIVLTVGLLMRYIVLILLLIVSPLAFLAVALPNTGHLAQQWWSAFIKYVLYGPIAVFILVLTVAASQSLGSSANLVGKVDTGFLNGVLNLIVVIAMMIAAATASNKLGIMGAGAALNFVSKQGRRAGLLGLGVATAPARFVGNRVSDNVKDFGRETTKNLRKSQFGQTRTGKFLLGAERDKDGKLKKGEKSLGSAAGGAVRNLAPSVLANQKSRERSANAVAAAALPGGIVANAGNAALAGIRLRDADVLKALNKANPNNVRDLVRHTTDAQQVNAVVTNKDYLRDLDDAKKIELQVQVTDNGSLSADEKKEALKKLDRSLDDIDKE